MTQTRENLFIRFARISAARTERGRTDVKKQNRFRTIRIITAAAVIAALAVCLLWLSGCRKDEQPEQQTAAPTETVPLETLPSEPEPEPGILFFGENAPGYTLLCPAGCSLEFLNACEALRESANDGLPEGSASRVRMEYDDFGGTEYEILVGSTNRPESSAAVSGLKSGDFTVKTAGKKLVIAGADEAATEKAIEWFTEYFVNGRDATELPEDFCYIRSKAPTISGMSQENLYWDLSTDTPDIRITVSSPDGSAPELAGFTVDGKDAASRVNANRGTLTMSGISFESGMHTARVALKAADGSFGYEIFRFGTGECDSMNLYKGEIHAHTADSDGIGTPQEAYEYARDVAGLDFFAVTDHSNSYSEANYKSIHVPLADEYNAPGKFVAFCGYEETYNQATGYYGHLNTINTSVYAVRNERLDVYYKKMARATGAVVQFNHPGYTWGNFLEYGLYSEGFDKVVNLFEFKGSGYDNEWALCLAKGWHVSPMHNEDNHAGNWGTVNEAVGYVLSPSLTRQNIVEAMSENRTYTTTDQSLKIYFSVNGVWMGGRLDSPDEINVSVRLQTAKHLGTVSLIAEDNITVASIAAGNKRELDWNLTLTPEFDYYYVKVNGYGFAVTAPVWIENRNKINVTGMDRQLLSYDNNSDNDHRVSVSFKAEEAMTDVTVRFYRSGLAGFDISKTKSIKKITVGSLAAGETAEVFTDVAYVWNLPRITAVVSGAIGGKTYSDTLYLQLTPILFSEIAGSGNGYSFIEIYNATADAIDLSNYSVRLWPKSGAKADALAENTHALSGTLQPHSAAVLWLKTNDSLTLSDFNAKYGCFLEEGRDVFILPSAWTAPLTGGVQMDILRDTTVISRAQYNFGADRNDIADGKSVLFAYQRAYTLTAVKSKICQIPTPGVVETGLMPGLIEKAA